MLVCAGVQISWYVQVCSFVDDYWWADIWCVFVVVHISALLLALLLTLLWALLLVLLIAMESVRLWYLYAHMFFCIHICILYLYMSPYVWVHMCLRMRASAWAYAYLVMAADRNFFPTATDRRRCLLDAIPFQSTTLEGGNLYQPRTLGMNRISTATESF